MKKTSNYILKLVLAALLLIGCVSPAVCEYKAATPPPAWRTTPTLSNDISTDYTFQSTSSYTSVLGSSYSPMASGSQLLGDGPGLPDIGGDNPIGTVDDPAPIGEPLVLLVLALLYAIYRKRKDIFA